MAPNSVDNALIDAVATYADAGDFESAVWWSERVFAASPTLDHLLRLAQYILQSNNALRAYGVLKGYQPPPGAVDEIRERRRRFLLARICFVLGRYQEAELTLLEHEQPGAKPASLNPDYIPNGACGLHLLGQICMKQNRRTAALAYFMRCLETDGKHWGAYSAMCQMGAAVTESFRIDPNDHCSMADLSAIQPILSPSPASVGISLDFSTPQNQSNSAFLDAAADETPMRLSLTAFRKPPLGSIRKPQPRSGRDPPGIRTPRRSERLMFTATSSAASDRDSGLKAFTERGNQVHADRTVRRLVKRGKERVLLGENEVSPPHSSMSLSQAVSTISQAYRFLHLFQCQEAIDAFMKLPESQFNTHWILVQLGRAYFELNHYQKACEIFERARHLDPYNLDGVEIYSTALWQLKQEVKLAFLAQQTLSMTRMSPEPWIAVGNCFSVQKEHETAIKFFERATQLDPGRTYAYTLMAHEYISNEDFDKAIAAFRNAIRIDERHYNAWYGLGTIYYRQEKYNLSIYHFLRAIKINSRNSVLECYLGMVYHASQSSEEALIHLDKSCQLEPKNLLPKFQKANVLFSMEKYDLAMEKLEQLADLAPREASVHFLMGRICKKRGELVNALLHFTICLDLDPNDRNLVKANIERLHSLYPRHGIDDSIEDEDDDIAGF